MCIQNQIADIYIELLSYACLINVFKFIKDLYQITKVSCNKSSQTAFSPKPNKKDNNIHTANPINSCDLQHSDEFIGLWTINPYKNPSSQSQHSTVDITNSSKRVSLYITP
jgi:hypothetical protein